MVLHPPPTVAVSPTRHRLHIAVPPSPSPFVPPPAPPAVAAAEGVGSDTAQVLAAAASWLAPNWEPDEAPFPSALALAQVGAALLELEADAWVSMDAAAAPAAEETFEPLYAHLRLPPPALPSTVGDWPLRPRSTTAAMAAALAFVLPPIPTFGLGGAATPPDAVLEGDDADGAAASLVQALRRGGARLAAPTGSVPVAAAAVQAVLCARVQLLYGFAVARRLHGRGTGNLIHVALTPDAAAPLNASLSPADGALPYVASPTVATLSMASPRIGGATGSAWSASALLSPGGAGGFAADSPRSPGMYSPRLLVKPPPVSGTAGGSRTTMSRGSRPPVPATVAAAAAAATLSVATTPGTDPYLPVATSRASRGLHTLLRAAGAADVATRDAARGDGYDSDAPPGAPSESADIEVGLPLTALLGRLLPRA